ncbi:type I glyceraldehyde-3-phosphate dehydrogenase [Mollicutes bacterium LVI A0039]|nr:type I glyceraldehyde-3-phosphate dehydrogenase [Mollicutes bacterium LVI A0039]
MATKIAINGFGRIGRLAFRQMFGSSEFDIVAINDLTDAKTLAHLLKYDSAQGSYKVDAISATDKSVVVDGKEIRIYSERNPQDLPWGELDVDVVLECTGFFASKEGSQAHINAGAKKVLISAPGGDVPTVVYNVNHDILDGSETIISGASCTTNCLAPMAQAMDQNFGIKHGIMTTIHAFTGDQNTLDAPHGDLRRARAASASIVPNTTGAAKAIGLVLPSLNGKLDGAAQRVPTITGSLTELTLVLEKNTTVEEINAAMKAASNESYGYNEDLIVSTDIIGTSFGSIFDATQTKIIEVNGEQLVKVVAWYDNEMSYTNQLVRTAKHFASLI